MPELPEVETVRGGLAPVMAGRRVMRLEVRRPDLRFPFPDRFAARVEGKRIHALGRRAKYLTAALDSGETLIMHLGMSGRFTIAPGASARPSASDGMIGDFVHATGGDARHDHVVFHMEGGATVTYNDPRRFGFMLMAEAGQLEAHPLIHGLGVEPLDAALSPAYLARRASGREVDLKAFLLDQHVVAGLGNIYVSEALFRAGLSPHRAAGCLARARGTPTARAERLVPAIREVLAAAIAAGGSTLRDYKQADGALGYFQHQFLVYGRAGEACLRPGCRGMVRRTMQAGRSTFSCPACQR